MSLRTLVTGATGFIGAAALAQLARDGVEAYGTSRKGEGSLHGCDLTNPDQTLRLLESVRPQRVLHLASQVTGARGVEAVLDTVQGSLLTTVNLLVAATRVGVESVVVAGSLEEYPADEAARYPYAAAKRACHEYVRYFAAAHGLPVVTARLGMVYGPRERHAQRLVPYVIATQLRGEAPLISNGARRVDWVYVDDVVDGLLALSQHAKSSAGAAFDVGTGRATSTADVVALITHLTGGPAAVFGGVPPRANDVDFAADAERTARAISWRAGTTLEGGLRQTVDWYQGKAARA